MTVKLNVRTVTCTMLLILSGIPFAEAQTSRRGKTITKKTVESSVRQTRNIPSVPQPTPTPAGKRNERPAANLPAASFTKDRPAAGDRTNRVGPVYRYEFTQPAFVVSNIKIEHDNDGAGTITFEKKGSEETITDPVSISPKALARINDALSALNFLESTENYQYEKDFSHLGTIKFSLDREGKSRHVTFNWTENKDAKILMTEYRRIANQFIWMFDITLSRENQPLESPRLMDSLDSMIRRNDISDPYQLEPFLKELADDERIPLIARNHAARLVKQFEKERAKEEKKKPTGMN